MQKVSKKDYKRAKELGFKPQYSISSSNSKKYYYLTDVDYYKLTKILNTRIEKTVN